MSDSETESVHAVTALLTEDIPDVSNVSKKKAKKRNQSTSPVPPGDDETAAMADTSVTKRKKRKDRSHCQSPVPPGEARAAGTANLQEDSDDEDNDNDQEMMNENNSADDNSTASAKNADNHLPTGLTAQDLAIYNEKERDQLIQVVREFNKIKQDIFEITPEDTPVTLKTGNSTRLKSIAGIPINSIAIKVLKKICAKTHVPKYARQNLDGILNAIVAYKLGHPRKHNLKKTKSPSRLAAGNAGIQARAEVSTGKQWTVYLAGEIHSDWREVISQGVQQQNLPVMLTLPITSRENSDDCGAIILGMQDDRHNWDQLGARMNQIRTQTLLRQADLVVVRFGGKYGQWNAALDAGYAAALGKPIITLHPPSLLHMLKEVNACANVVCHEPEQVVQTLAYVIAGGLPQTPRDGDAFVPIADRLGTGNPNL